MRFLNSGIFCAAPFRRLLRGFAHAAARLNGYARGCAPGLRIATAFSGTAAALAVLTAFLSPVRALAAAQGDLIVNYARLSGTNISSVASTVSVSVVVRTSSRIELLTYSTGATAVNVAVGAYRNNGGAFVTMASPVLLGSATSIDMTNPVPLGPATVFHQGQPVFIRVTDPDQNLNRNARETVVVTISDNSTGDIEVVRLTETGLDTGVFTGYIQTAGNSSASQYNGTLSITSGSNITATYADTADSGDNSTASALVDPYGIVFSSATGKPINGVKITLIDVATGNTATVLGDDGVSTFPSSLTTGGTTTDSSGRSYDFPPGGFRFPFVAPGNYQFKLEAPSGYSGPSTVSEATLQALPNAPFALQYPGSDLKPFVINAGPAIHIDIPLDPVTTSLWLQKTAGKETVAIGDFLPYELDVQNTDKVAIAQGVVITDTMPIGFRFKKGSARFNGIVAADPAISADGRTLSFTVGDLAPQTTLAVRYVVEVAAGAVIGTATNVATAKNTAGATSNLARASVQVRSDFLSSRSILMGQVIDGACGSAVNGGAQGVEGVRIFMEDGTFVDSDKRGMFHFEGVTPGSHVVQLDPDSLPKGYEVVPCEENTRFAGSTYSQFVDVQGGSMWRVDFHVVRRAGPGESTLPGMEKSGQDQSRSPGKAGAPSEKEGFLSPGDSAVLIHPINAVRVCIPVSLTPRLLLDGKEISADRIGFSLKDSKTGKATYSYIGVDFGSQGEHSLRVQGIDPFGNARFDQSVKIVRSGEIAGIRLKGADGNIADGKTPIRLQLELLDSSGRVVPAEADLELRGGTLKALKKESALPDSAPAKTGDKTERVHIDAQGNALFQPVNNSGPYHAVIGYNKVSLEAETYVKPKMRDWILVGLGEGTIGYNAVSGHMENLVESDQEEHFYDNGRLAFYAKGKIKGEWLLTFAYDSAKGKGGAGNSSLFQTIDPNTYYTLYGDATQQQYDASSARKIYVKIERDQFYALFGDFDTGLTVAELSRYSRRMNGFKSEYQGKYIEANVFGTETAQAYARDEIRGDGTSGLYHLSRTGIVINSDKITIETRDRFRSEIILNTTPMSRFTDYSIDYDSGAIFFKQPVASRDENYNPIFIVAEYETNNGGSQAYTYGGRVGAKLLDQKLKAGFTYIHEGQVSGQGNSYGLDANYKIMEGTTLKAEVARTDTRFGNTASEGNAYLAEMNRHSEKLDARLYFRELGEGFGLGQQNGTESATRKGGLDAAYKLTDKVTLGGQAYRQYNLSTGGVQDVADANASYSDGTYGAHLGGRYASDKLGDGSVKTSEQLTFGASWLTLNKRLTLHADRDQSIGGNNNASFPTRTTFGADFKMTEKVALFAQQEITSGGGAKTNTTNVGMKSSLWEGGEVNSSMGRNLNENGDRMFALFGLKQTLKITDKWSVAGGVERSQTIKNSGSYQFNTNVPPASGDNQDFTAVSVGTTYTEKKWNTNSRLEVRTSDTEDKWGLVTAYVGEPKEGWGWSARCELFDVKSAAGVKTVNGDLRLGMVYRPLFTRWIILDRLDFLYDKQSGGTTASTTTTTTGSTVTSLNTQNRRVVNNLSANYKLDNKTQISLLYGAKYVYETIDGADYSGFTDLVGLEGRYDLTKKWDIGLRGSVLHSWNAGRISYSTGPSVGFNVFKNAWVSIGYNLVGFTDKDFSASDYTAQGPYVRFSFKFDQNSVREAADWINRL